MGMVHFFVMEWMRRCEQLAAMCVVRGNRGVGVGVVRAQVGMPLSQRGSQSLVLGTLCVCITVSCKLLTTL